LTTMALLGTRGMVVGVRMLPDGVRVLPAESARTTHGAEECVEASRLFGGMICRALAGASKDDVLFGDAAAGGPPRIAAIARGEYVRLAETDVRGTGYVVESLEAALWCFAHTDDYPSAVLRAANLGDDADTTAAVCGQLAGAFYGAGGIPLRWRTILAMRDRIEALANDLYQAGAARGDERDGDEPARGNAG